MAQVQRALWVSDLRATVHDLLVRIRDSASPFSDDLRRECLLLEGTLRESLAARNLMSEQLSKLTEDARRRGVSLTFVDSRSTPPPSVISRAVLAEVQNALARTSTSRVVVRLAPDRDDSASVVSSDDTTTSITTIDHRAGAAARSDARWSAPSDAGPGEGRSGVDRAAVARPTSRGGGMPVGCHALVWTGTFGERELTEAAAKNVEAGFDLLELALLDPFTFD